jgi:hypothetical protein
VTAIEPEAPRETIVPVATTIAATRFRSFRIFR